MRSFVVLLCGLSLAGVVGLACGGNDESTFKPPGSSGSSGAGSSSGFGGEGDGGPGSLVPIDDLFFDPPAVTVTVLNGVTQKVTYALKAKRPDGVIIDAPGINVQFDRPDIATLKAGQPVELTTKNEYAGTGNLRAVYNGKTASATLTVILKVEEIGAGVSPAAVAGLKASGLPADPSVTSILYPYDKTVFPLGLASPLYMWAAPKAGDVYRLHLEESNYAYDGFFTVATPAQLRVPQNVWDRITASNKAEPLKVTLSRWDTAASKAYVSANQEYTISPASLRGAIYYWTTSGTGHLARIRPGTGTAPEILNGGKCMGCHGVSADGSTLVAVEEDRPSTDEPTSSTRAWVSYDLPGATVRKVSSAFGGNVAVNPNGKFVVYGNQKLKLADTATGTLVASSGLANVQTNGTYPDFAKMMTPAFSPDGKKLAAVSGEAPGSYWYHNLRNGHLVVMDFNETTRTFSGGTALAAASAFPANQRALSYPSFAPDSAHVAFHVGDYPTGCDDQGCDDFAKQIGSVWLQKTSGAAPIALTKMNDSSALVADRNLTLEPTFNPVERGGYFWVVVTSMRDWGNKLTGVANNGKKRLWVAAIDKNVGTVDPSHPAFYLEGQEDNTTNMRGFWALASCLPTPKTPGGGGGTCSAGFECCSGFCDKGVCIDPGVIACQPVGGSCAVDADCCNGDVVKCDRGVCRVPPPK